MANSINEKLFHLAEKLECDTGKIVEFLLETLENDEVMQQRFKEYLKEN